MTIPEGDGVLQYLFRHDLFEGRFLNFRIQRDFERAQFFA